MRILFCCLLVGSALTGAAQTFTLIVGTYTNTGNLAGADRIPDSTGSKGIYLYRLQEDEADGRVPRTRLVSHTRKVCNPSFLTIAPDHQHLYACTESLMRERGTVSAFSIDVKKGRVTFINKLSSEGDNPAYVSIHPRGHFAAVANYSGGSLSVFPIGPLGELKRASTSIRHLGHGVDSVRQDRAHVHSVVFSPAGDYLYVQDLGLDQISILPFDAGAGLGETLVAGNGDSRESTIRTRPGSGPRHLTFNPDGRFAYLLEEMGGSIDVYRVHPESGGLDSVQRVAAHAEDAAGPFHSADIHLSTDGHFLYASNREPCNSFGDGSLAIFAVDSLTGRLTSVGFQPVDGKEPRNFALDPTGRFLLVADQLSDKIVIFRRDVLTGLLKRTGATIRVPSPSCLAIF